jgi:hypothetical protein
MEYPMLTADWTDTADIPAYLAFLDAVGIEDETVPLRVWASESDNHAAAHNPDGDASGVFQLMPATAKDFGYNLAADPHLAAFRASGVAGQLVWATRFYSNHAGHVGTVARFYTCTFLPALLECADDSGFVLAAKGGPLAWAYDANRSFDHAGKGHITVQDLVDATVRATGPRTRELIARVQTAKAARAATEPAPPT